MKGGALAPPSPPPRRRGRLPPAPLGSKLGSPVGPAGDPSPLARLPGPAGFSSCSSVRLWLPRFVRPLRPRWGLGPARPPSARPARSSGGPRPRAFARPFRAGRRGVGSASPRPPRLWGRSPAPGAWPPRRWALVGGRGRPPAALCGPVVLSPPRFRPGPPSRSPARRGVVLCASVGSPLRPPPAAPAGGSGSASFQLGSGSRFSRPCLPRRPPRGRPPVPLPRPG